MLLAHDINKGDRTKDVKITQNITFETMLLSPNTIKGLKDSGFHKPSPIQLYGIPIGKCGFDLLLEAKSGTGKTAVFTIIALEKLDYSKGLQVVILTPTREIAAQIYDVLKQIGCRYKELKVEVVMGGLPVQDDIEKFKKPVHIVVGSPGRLKQLIQNEYIETKSVRLLVFDEADKLMENSFQSDIKFIHTALPKQKQVIMSSATYPECSRNLIDSFVQNASHVCPDSDCILLGIEQKVSFVKYNSNIVRQTQERFKELHNILSRMQFKQCLVFCNYQVRVTEVHKLLKKGEWPSQKLYGQQEQTDRLDALKTLQQYECRILVATDLAARGIDASNIDLVVNFEPPHDWQTYLHRIGRAGRFGTYGLAVTILSEGIEQQQFKQMFKSIDLLINMRHLWNDKEYNLRDSPQTVLPDHCKLQSDNSTTANLLEKVSCKSMWELLSGKSNAMNSSETESRNELETKPEIPTSEPFSELMLSLKDEKCQHSDVDIVFKHMEIRHMSTSSSIISQNSAPFTNNIIKEIQINKDEDINHGANEKIKDSKAKKASNASINTNNDINNTTSNKEKTDEQLNIMKSMLNLELPVTFTSSKCKSQDTKWKIKETMSENKTYCNNDTQFNKNNNLRRNYMQTQLEENAKISLVKCDTGKDSDPFFKENEIRHKNRTKVINNYDRTNKFYVKEHKYNNNPQQQKITSSHIPKSPLEKLIERNKTEKLYTIWYNQLKMRMKQIEQTIYMNEMSKF